MSITATVLVIELGVAAFVTYARVPSGVIAMVQGAPPTATVLDTVFVAVLITKTLPEF
jgi:hypothetical protein